MKCPIASSSVIGTPRAVNASASTWLERTSESTRTPSQSKMTNIRVYARQRDVALPDRSLDPRRPADPQPRGARPAGRDRQLVRAPAGAPLRRRPRRLGDGLELRDP